jgi:hypothetical protein
MILQSAENNHVPPHLMMAVAHIEGGLMLAPIRDVDDDDAVPIAGVLELRHGGYDSLGRGAELVGMTERELSIDRAAGTEAGARVLDELARENFTDRADLAAWAPVIEKLSGHRHAQDRADYRARVYRLLRSGGTLKTYGGEVIVLPAHEDLPIGLTFTLPLLETLGVPEYPGAIWIDTSCANKCNTSRSAPISMIAIHDTEGGWDASVATLQNDPGKSVHYIVDRDGSRAGQFIPESYTGWHVGNSYYNARMIGIEHVGYAGVDDYQTSMYLTSADLVKDIAQRNGLTVDRSTLIAHGEVPNGNNIPSDSPPCTDSPGSCVSNLDYGGASHHTDPGIYWEWCQYMELCGGTCKCNDAYDLWNCVYDLSMMVRCNAGTVEIVHCADTCVVEPIGTDDHCTPQVNPTGAGGSGAGGAGGLGGAPANTGAGVGGAGLGWSSEDDDLPPNPAQDSSCALSAASFRSDAPAEAAALLAALAFRRSRRRRRTSAP